MFAIGFLSLLTAGFAAMSMGGGGDADEYDAEDTTAEDSIEPAPVAQGAGDIDLQFQPADELAPGLDEQIDNFEESDPEASDPATGDEAADQPDPIVADSADEEAQSPTEEVARPPMGDEYRDPLVIAEELDAQREIEEALAEEARQPENLVTVSDGSGSEVDDGLVLSERDETADETDPAFNVIAPESANTIDVGYDAEHTFGIEYTAETSAITAGLNSNIEGPDGSLMTAQTVDEDENGTEVTTLTTTKSFEGSTDITLEVDSDHIGSHISEIDLSNPNDTLHFEFSDDVTGNVHLIFEEAEDGRANDTSVIKRAYVIETPAGVESLTDAQIQSVLADPDGQAGDLRIVSEIYLGEDAVTVNGDPEDMRPYELRIDSFVNDDPTITSNLDWASVENYEEPEGGVVMTDDSGSADGTETLGGNIGATLTGLSVPFSIPGFG